jgi:hypothetical protein
MDPEAVADLVMSILCLRTSVQKKVLQQLRHDIDTEIIPHKKASVLKSKSFESLAEFSWDAFVDEMFNR